MNEIIKIENINIENLIYEIRGVHVMLASDALVFIKLKQNDLMNKSKETLNGFPTASVSNFPKKKPTNWSQIATGSNC